MHKRLLTDRISHLALPLSLLGIDLCVRGRVLAGLNLREKGVYVASAFVSLLIFRAVEWGLRGLRSRGYAWTYRSVLALMAGLYTFNLILSYAYFAANRVLPDQFMFSYLRWETGHALIMARDAFHWTHALGLLGGGALIAALLHHVSATPARPWDLPWGGKLLHGILAASALIYCGHRALAREQCFVPDVNLLAMGGRYTWLEIRGKNPPPIRLRPRTPAPIGQSFPTPPVNVLLILNESLRRQNLQLYGYGRATTPHQQRFAQIHSREFFLFRRAFSNSSGTLLSVPSLLTGISPLSPVDERSRAPLLWEWAKASTMSTFLVSSQDLSWCAMDRFFKTPAPDLFWDKQNSGKPLIRDYGIDDTFTVDRALQHIEELSKAGKRFAGVIHLNTNHYPYNTAPAFQRWKGKPLDAYDNTVFENDTHVGRILDTLAKLGRLEDTVILFTSDHGEAFEEHGYIAHFYCHYAETVSVPLWIYLPPKFLKERGRTQLAANLRTSVQNLDVLPTLLDTMGIWQHRPASPLLQRLQGTSLLSLVPLERNITMTNADEVLASTVGLSLVRGNRHYLLRTSVYPPQEGLYNLDSDPWERKNLWKQTPEDARRSFRAPFLANPLPAKIIRTCFPEMQAP